MKRLLFSLRLLAASLRSMAQLTGSAPEGTPAAPEYEASLTGFVSAYLAQVSGLPSFEHAGDDGAAGGGAVGTERVGGHGAEFR